MKFFYLVHFQYLGFRYHGYAIQPEVKTVQKMIEKTIKYILEENKFKTLITSRTDAMVSAEHSVFELFLEKEIDEDWFLSAFNENIPPDIRATKIEKTDKEFNVIQNPKHKEYIYLFSYGEKAHPFSASMIAHFIDDFDIEKMKLGAKLFLGEHNFYHYCKVPKPSINYVREITHCEIIVNDIYTANFFPEQSFAFHVHSKGFMRNQIRLMMGQLIELGKGLVSLDSIEESLRDSEMNFEKKLAPASGLILNKVAFD